MDPLAGEPVSVTRGGRLSRVLASSQIRTGRDKLTSRCLSAHQARQLAHGDQPRGHSQRHDRTKQETAKSLSRSLRGKCPNITLLDLTLLDMNDIDVLQTRCDSHPDPRIVDLTT
jgi:hypothetical protein